MEQKPISQHKKAQKTIRQHFVPQFYLRRFANQDGLIERLDLPTATVLGNPASPKSECHDAFFYALETGKEDEMSQIIEDFWKALEDEIGGRMHILERHIVGNEPLTEEDHETLANLGAMLWMRTPYFRETINHNSANLQKQLTQLRASSPQYTEDLMRIAQKAGKPMTREEAEKVRKFAQDGRYHITFNNALHLRFISQSFGGFTNLFYGGKWRFYIAGGEKQFVTSTSPCIEVVPERVGFYGADFYARKKFIPISPQVLAALERPEFPGKVFKRKTIDDEAVRMFNLQHANRAYTNKTKYARCYGSRTDELNDLVRLYHSNGNGTIIKNIVKSFLQGH